MENTISFEAKVRSMTARELILAMIEGLKNPDVVVDMDDFGYAENGVCYGCAATNAIAKIAGIHFTPKTIYEREIAVEAKDDYFFLSRFENAIDGLRFGDIEFYNRLAKKLKIAEISNHSNIDLPFLTTGNYLANLAPYEALAAAQDE